MKMALYDKAEVPTNFSAIKTPEELKLYLDDASARLKNSPYLFQYTTVDRVKRMLGSRLWHLGNAKYMNDELEYKNGDKASWNNLFFACFMCEDKESIGMWSMYAQPWEKGVKITLPSKIVHKWIKETKQLLEISIDDYELTGNRVFIGEANTTLRLSSVAYCNTDSLSDKVAPERIMWSTVRNEHIHNAARIPELTGYIKDMAWSYEKEIRIKAEFENINGFQRLAIPLTEDVINSMTITASPLFEGNLRQELEKVSLYPPKTDQSIFTKRLNIKSPCESCNYKKAQK